MRRVVYEWVLVLGARGGIGLAAVDVAGSLGARVIAAASRPAKRAASAAAGALSDVGGRRVTGKLALRP